MRFKKLQESGQPEYRQLLVPSPMTSLAEVIVMSALSTTESFQKPASVYSYLWPKSDDCPYNFEHYYKFYQKRNEDIAYVLRNNPRCLAIIADIEKFYPTIDHKLVQQRFEIRLVQGKLDLGVCNTARRLFSHLIAPFDNGKGIATGPDFGHVIGDLALCELDAELNKNLPGRYFRYVDDIIIVVEPDDKGRVLQLLHRLLEKEGLRTNGAKTDEVSSDEWLVHGPQPRRSVSEDSFEALRFRLKVFLALRPGRYESLQRALLDEGFFIPLGRMRLAADTNWFRRRLRVFHKSRWGVLMTALLDSEKSLVDFAIRVRRSIRDHLMSVLACEFPRRTTRRRWHSQRVRYLTNRILYLQPAQELMFVREALENEPDFAETVALLRFLQEGEIGGLLKMPGPAVGAAASLLLAGSGGLPPIILPEEMSEPEIHSAAVLLLYGAARLGRTGKEYADEGHSEFLSFCAGQVPSSRERRDFSYLDEIRSLQLSRTAEEARGMLENRFSDDEGVPFEALEIGGGYFS